MATSRILGPDGQHIKTPDLAEPQTARLAHLQRELQSHPTRGLTPSRLAKILDAAENGDLVAQFELFEDMEEKVTSCFRESYGQKICQRERRLQNMRGSPM